MPSKIRSFFLLLSLLSISSTSMAAFSDGLIGARTMGMGGAFSSISNDADGIMLNPASLTNVNAQQLSVTASAIYLGLSDQSLISQGLIGYSNSTERASVGLALKQMNAAGLYFESLLALGAAKSFGFGSQGSKNLVAIGASLKILSWDSAATVGSDGGIVEDLSGWRGISFDAGLIIRLSKNTAAGIALQNFNTPNIASEKSLVEEKLPTNIILGVGTASKNATWALDFNFGRNEVDVRTGIELNSYEGRALLRLGFRLENLAWGTNITLGGSIKPLNSVRLDYAFIQPVGNVEDTLGSHRVSVVYDF